MGVMLPKTTVPPPEVVVLTWILKNVTPSTEQPIAPKATYDATEPTTQGAADAGKAMNGIATAAAAVPSILFLKAVIRQLP
jgi:hypothetical protein